MPPQSDFKKAHEYDREFFPITSLHRDDIKNLYIDEPDYEEKCTYIDSMGDDKMTYLAEKMAEDYCEQLFHDSLKTIFEELFLNEIKVNDKKP